VEHLEKHQVMHDELTGLSTRAYFMDMLDRCAARAARREGYQFAVLFLDLDGFKTVNDTLGHAVGDELLVTVARKLEACVRPGDVVARLGGDEFTVLLDDIENGSDATRVAARVIASLRRPAMLASANVNLDGSIGIALSESLGTGEELLRSADLAMYRAKRRGRGRYEVFDRAMHAEAVERLRLEAELRNAVERREFELFYQPVVDPSAGQIRGAEVLMRWNHPERGVIPADDFITVANETGLIVALGTWMLREACHQVAKWQTMFPSRPPLSLSVNFCRREMQNPDLLGRVERLLEETGLQPHTLRIEVTENSIADSYDASPHTYHDLERLGVGFQIDDFGTGSSSLSLLHRFPVSAVKIDRSFVFDITDSEESRRVVRYIAAVATAMGVDVIAEGVETAQQESWLRDLGCCALAQGYRYSKPVNGAEFGLLLEAQAGHSRSDRLAG
jgi:diguanylate cyclase (GGDEF)-like protein